ncbi:hypothetical protein ACHIPZ_13590 [Antrihabitans sp. NCIMB 15449]|uniref:IrrE N-terminal-like domain-containing protein n=1 Tax=Antrihabitans spumae TaxID=3373370 RepID=A0ABW7JML5_9NOCA
MSIWHPWRALRDDHPRMDVAFPHIDVVGCYGRRNGSRIEIESTSNQAERRCTLTHEIIHVERGPVPKHPYFGPQEERIVRRLTAERLIELEPLVDALAWNRWQVDADTAGDLWVDLPTLVTRVKNLTEDERRYIDAEIERRQP